MSGSILTSYFKIILPFNMDISFFMVPIMLAAYKYKAELISGCSILPAYHPLIFMAIPWALFL